MDTGTYALRDLPEDVARVVMSEAKRQRYGANVVIFHEDDPADTLHIVVEGHVKIVVTTPLGQQLAFRVIGPARPSASWRSSLASPLAAPPR